MLSTWRFTTFGLSCLLAAVALAQAGCSGPNGVAQEQPPKAQPAGVQATAETPAKKDADDRKWQLNDPLLRHFGQLLDKADDVESADKKGPRKILEEADPLLTRIRQENRRAIERANRPPIIHRPKPKQLVPLADKKDATTKKADPPASPDKQVPIKHVPAEKGK
jgi:hypothetical protein